MTPSRITMRYSTSYNGFYHIWRPQVSFFIEPTNAKQMVLEHHSPTGPGTGNGSRISNARQPSHWNIPLDLDHYGHTLASWKRIIPGIGHTLPPGYQKWSTCCCFQSRIPMTICGLSESQDSTWIIFALCKGNNLITSQHRDGKIEQVCCYLIQSARAPPDWALQPGLCHSSFAWPSSCDSTLRQDFHDHPWSRRITQDFISSLPVSFSKALNTRI
ncbi:hypothetical protein QBC37DRAFT_418323 [Rhypophila decipiens]|uniref:Uncharacterized protein n=1 Tax=Rhypophila decipiens TaxID=261697 RepID=A0AAN6YC14_9PEZI|nr:hypothetical protein QBC37DRAFT_418323 [Rhypophila decipiens]